MQDLKGIGYHMRAQELWWQEEVPRAPVPLHLYLFVPTKVRSVSLLWGMLASLAIRSILDAIRYFSRLALFVTRTQSQNNEGAIEVE